jgi:hypothetical protein
VVGHLEAEAAAQRQGAQALLDRQLDSCSVGFRCEESVVEGGVVGDQDAVFEGIQERREDVGEPGGAGEALGGQTVDVHRAGITASVDQRGQRCAFGPARGVELERGDAEDPAAARVEPGGLDIHHSPRKVVH